MRLAIISSFICAIAIWLLAILFFLNLLPAEWFSAEITQLKKPTSVNDLGESMGIIDGLFSSLAVFLALVAVIFQGRELKDSTAAQNEQAEALTDQVRRQDDSLQLQAKQTEALLEQIKKQDQSLQLQAKQTEALLEQLKKQDESNLLSLYYTRIKVLNEDKDSTDYLIKRLEQERNDVKKQDTRQSKQQKINNCHKKVARLNSEIEEIDQKVKGLLLKLEEKSNS